MFMIIFLLIVLLGKILSALLNGVKNANAGVIKQAYSSAIGSVIKVLTL